MRTVTGVCCLMGQNYMVARENSDQLYVEFLSNFVFLKTLEDILDYQSDSKM